ncbi:hypothetical protein J7J00_16465 [Bacillus sp. ISL-4]|uniref:hypothetical protein n=1 Tax=Bacillus sp. ISL-4 TaxID=2819125 RepID=UPI001BE9D180|nr:hypothetical protein [Bacillus sp. ISL-4]MBT2667092.1 hypothetical protein [Bacillus sp. ISL-4]
MMVITLVFGLFFAIAPMNKAFALSYDNTNPYSTGCVSKSQSLMKRNIFIKTV